ncbi:hypothetical protein R3P38DRAFT_3041007 [Favolaschia claudopus]|uniref:Uncharacterized protein n=1 Tax=Favolaschia claudopus TaxID=2862362 RepID=A0AAW0A9Y9_9AGAR
MLLYTTLTLQLLNYLVLLDELLSIASAVPLPLIRIHTIVAGIFSCPQGLGCISGSESNCCGTLLLPIQQPQDQLYENSAGITSMVSKRWRSKAVNYTGFSSPCIWVVIRREIV